MRRDYVALSSLLVCSMLAGCSMKMPWSGVGVAHDTIFPEWQGAPGDDIEVSILEGIPSIQRDVIQSVMEQQKGLFYYDHLSTEQEQVIYAEILTIIGDFMGETSLSSDNASTIERVFQCVLNDHPEIFYVDGYSSTSYSYGNDVFNITMTASYTMDPADVGKYAAMIDWCAEECLGQIDDLSDDYEKLKYIYEWIIDNTTYDINAPDNQNIKSVFLSNRSVCMGYARTVQYLLSKLGMESTVVCGMVSGGEVHAWNLVKSDGDYYYMDATWGDATYQMNENAQEDYGGNIPSINYDYFLVTTSQLMRTHVIDRNVPVPEFNATQDNYYVREGLYFVTVDEGMLTEAFDKAYKDGRQSVTLKCADRAVYEEMCRYMVREQGIFHYIKSNGGSVPYTNSNTQYSLTFWIGE